MRLSLLPGIIEQFLCGVLRNVSSDDHTQGRFGEFNESSASARKLQLQSIAERRRFRRWRG